MNYLDILIVKVFFWHTIMKIYLASNKPQSEQTSIPSKYPQGYFNSKLCKCCGKLFNPSAPSHMYCSQECADIGLQDAYLKRCYGIDTKEYFRLYNLQNKLCKLCNKEGFKMLQTHKLKLVVDHCHKTGKVRGLLCHNCNRGLGLFKDDVSSLLRAIKYLESATTISKESTSQANGDGSGEPLIQGWRYSLFYIVIYSSS